MVNNRRSILSLAASHLRYWSSQLLFINPPIKKPLGGLPADAAHRFARGILVFAVGSVAGLASAFFGYIGRTLRLEYPGVISWRTPWFAIIASVIGVICFLAGVNMARHAVVLTASVPQAQTPAPSGETGNPEGQ